MNGSSDFLQGENISLQPLEPAHASKLVRWLNDPVVTHYMFYGQRPRTEEQVAAEFRRHVESPDNAVFTIEIRSSRSAIGFAGLYDIHPAARKAEFRILIGEAEAWGKGLGTETTELLAFYAFDRLNLNRLWLGVTAENERAVKAYERAGYRVEGRLRQDIYRNSRYYDSVRMSILRDEYYPEMFERHRKRFAISIAGGEKK